MMIQTLPKCKKSYLTGLVLECKRMTAWCGLKLYHMPKFDGVTHVQIDAKNWFFCCHPTICPKSS